jgi:hypothetical protein
MGCCGKSRRRPKPSTNQRQRPDVMGGYKYLPPHQVRARLEVFKKRYCKDCEKRYDCDYKMYQQCQKYKIGGK